MFGRTELPSGLVTFLFTDIEGSTRLARMLGDDYAPVLLAHRAVIRAALYDFGGHELLTEGDSFFVAFRDAAAAVAAGAAAQRGLTDHPWPSPDVRPRVRMGLHTGWAVPTDDGYASAEVHRAARVAAAAHGGQIICSRSTVEAAAAWPTNPSWGTPRPPARTAGAFPPTPPAPRTPAIVIPDASRTGDADQRRVPRERADHRRGPGERAARLQSIPPEAHQRRTPIGRYQNDRNQIKQHDRILRGRAGPRRTTRPHPQRQPMPRRPPGRSQPARLQRPS